MVILGSRNSLIENEIIEAEEYKVPAVFKHDEKEMSLKKSIFLSAILHPTAAGLVAVILFVLMLMGISLSIFDKPKPKMNDITFVLVDTAREQMPLNRKTNLRSAKNTRRGGNHSKRREVYMPSPEPAKKSSARESSAGNNSKKHATSPRNIFKSLMQPKHGSESRPHPPSARPSLKPPSVPNLTLKPASPFAVPIPKTNNVPTGRTYSTGQMGGHGTTVSGGSHSGTGKGYVPVASFSPTGGGESSSGSRLSGGGSGYSGNPGGGGGTAGVDSISDFDMSPYVKQVQKKIQMNWDPPKGNEDKTAVVSFKIGKEGRLVSRSVFKSSGIPNFDKQAINAIELAAPFKPLPVSYKKQYADFNFHFNYNLVH